MTQNTQVPADIEGVSSGVLKQMLEIGGAMTPMRDHPAQGKQVLVMPQGFKSEVLTDPDQAPQLTRRSPRFFETESFIAYVKEFKKEGSTRIFVNPEELKAVAVIDYDRPAVPDHGVHRATLALELSPEWKTWVQAAAVTKQRGFTQEDFAEFLEENGVNVRTPTAAELIELVTKMQITRTVNYKRVINLQDGRQQFTYTNDDGSGSVEFPAKLEIGIPVFKGGLPYKVTVLPRYRLQDGGSLRFGMIIHRMEEILQDALQGDVGMIQESTGVPVHIGAVS